jgi:hypothetical protein
MFSFIYNLFNESFNNSDNVASNDWMVQTSVMTACPLPGRELDQIGSRGGNHRTVSFV